MEVYMKSKAFFIRSFFENVFEYANEYAQNTPYGLIFSFTITIKPHTVKVYMKSICVL